MNLNAVDLLLGALILLSLAFGWRRGFLFETLDLATWLLSLWFSILFYEPVARWLSTAVSWLEAWGKPVGFLLVFFLSLPVLRLVLGRWIYALPPRVHVHAANKVLGLLPGLANGAIHATIAAALLMAFPLPDRLQTDARDSALQDLLVGYVEEVESLLRPVFDDAVSEALNARSVRPPSTEFVKLPFSVKQSKPMAQLEVQMLVLVNKERVGAGLKPLVMNDALIKVARMHSADMLARGYFSHYSPEGRSSFDRLRAERISFFLAGENLAFAPTVGIAHTGLMNSPRHRANILRPGFRKVGIGIMDAGPRGIMVTQQFSN